MIEWFSTYTFGIDTLSTVSAPLNNAWKSTVAITGSHPRPTWTELNLFLQHSVVIWLSIFVLTIIRDELFGYFFSSSLQDVVRRGKVRATIARPIFRFTKASLSASVRSFRVMFAMRFPREIYAFMQLLMWHV